MPHNTVHYRYKDTEMIAQKYMQLLSKHKRYSVRKHFLAPAMIPMVSAGIKSRSFHRRKTLITAISQEIMMSL